MQEFEDFLINNLPKIDTFHPTYQKALHEMLTAGGKRFRPKLLLSIVKAYEPLLVKSAMYPALALELFHTYSLIHDDLPAMDNASFRRGHPTLHTTYDEALAILIGDGLNTHAFELIASAPLRDDVKTKLTLILSRNGGSGGMVLGQAIDLYFENKPLSLQEIIELHTNKTAKLIAASLQMGAVIADAKSITEEKLYDFGIKLGILFQVQDDILDAVQTDTQAGKPTNNDSNKNSFVTLLGTKEAIEYADNLAIEIQKQFGEFEPNIQNALKPLMDKYLNRHKQ